MKKIVLIASVLTLIFTMNGNVYATAAASAEAAPVAIEETGGGNTDDMQQTREERKAAREQKKAEIKVFKEELQGKKEVVKENREKNKTVREENKNLREALTAKLKEIKESGSVLDADTAARLEAYKAELKSLNGELKETKGDIKEIIDANRENIKDLDYEAVEAAFDEISSIQSARYEDLVKINETLKLMIEMF